MTEGMWSQRVREEATCLRDAFVNLQVSPVLQAMLHIFNFCYKTTDAQRTQIRRTTLNVQKHCVISYSKPISVSLEILELKSGVEEKLENV